MNERKQLQLMLSEHKISNKDYQVLMEALEEKSRVTTSLLSVILNPFQKLAGTHALVAGLLVMIMLSLLALKAKMYLPGSLTIVNAEAIKNPKNSLNFSLILYQIGMSWVILSGFFITFSLIFRQKRLRLIDFLGTTAFSRFPYLFLMIFIYLIQFFDPSFFSIDVIKEFDLHPSFAKSIFGFGILVFIIWQLITYFNALKESSDLRGKRLWVGYILSIILAEVLSYPVTMFFV